MLGINLEEFWMGFGQILSGVLVGLLAFVAARVKLLWGRRAQSTKVIVNRNLRLNDLLVEMRVHYDADRVLLFQVHNGDYFVNGSSIQKFSMTNFVLGLGIASPDEMLHQNIPISYVANALDQVLKAPYYYATDVRSMPDDAYTKSLFRHNGTEMALFAGIFDRKHNLLGCVVVTWLENRQIDQASLDETPTFASRISDELTLRVP